MQRCFTNILSENVDNTAKFYELILNMKRHFDSDWFVILTHDELNNFEFGILQRQNDIVPEAIRKAPAGVIVTFVVSDCDVVYERASKLDNVIIEPPTNMPYGQRRILLRDPDGTIIDVSSKII